MRFEQIRRAASRSRGGPSLYFAPNFWVAVDWSRRSESTTRHSNPATPNVDASSSATLRIASFLLVVLAIVALGAVAYFTERGIAASRDLVIHTYQMRSQLGDLQLEILRAQADESTNLRVEKGQGAQSREQSALAPSNCGRVAQVNQG